MIRNKSNFNIQNINNSSKKFARSYSVINIGQRNKTIMNYVEMRLTRKEMKQQDNNPSGSSTSFTSSILDNNNYNPTSTVKGLVSPYISSLQINSIKSKGNTMISESQSRNTNKFKLLKEHNDRLLQQILLLTKENNDLKLENLRYKHIFSQLNEQNNHGQKSIDCDINTLSSKSNYD